jgi:DNA-binding FadR family transcriptional regulator
VRAAEVAAERRTDEDAEALLHEVDAMRRAGHRRDPFVKADLRFHEVVGRATGNPLFGLLGSALRDSLALTIRAGFDSRHSPAELARVVEIHAAIAEAIVRGDQAGAGRWIGARGPGDATAVIRTFVDR